MSFQLSVPPTPPALTNGFASHHSRPKDFPSSLTLQHELGSPPCSPSHLQSRNHTSPTNSHIDSLAHRHQHHLGDLQSPLHIKPDAHMLYSHPSALHSLSLPPPLNSSIGQHMHQFAPTVIPSHATFGGKHVGVLAGAGKHGVELNPPILSHTPAVIIAE